MGPHLAKLVNLHTLHLGSTCARWACVVVCEMFMLWCGAVDNSICAVGAEALGPCLVELLNLHALNIERACATSCVLCYA